FAAPVAIGTVAATASGVIPATIPAGITLGTGYLIRVTGSDPAIIAGNSTLITITEAPYAGVGAHLSFCDNDDPQLLLNYLPGASACGGWTDPTGLPGSGVLDPAVAISGSY